MSGRGEVFLGDLVRALSLLRPGDGTTAAAVADLLGLGPEDEYRCVLRGAAVASQDGPAGRPGEGQEQPVPSVPASAAAPGPRTDPPPATRPAPQPDGTAPPPPPQAPPPPPAWTGVRAPRLGERPLDFSLTLAASPADAPRPASAAGTDFSPDGPDDAAPRAPSPTYVPPWTPEWARGVMFAAVSTPIASRRLDQRTLSRKASRQEGLRAVPWQRRSSTRRGVQLLLDHGAGMAPFQDDRRWLTELAGSIAGRDRVEVLHFRDAPLRGVVRSDPARPQDYRPPAPGTPVVLVSDMGRARPAFTGASAARLHEWQDFVRLLLRSGCPAVCVTPFAAAEYPRSLRDGVALIPFDRRISLGHVREATRRIRRMTEERRP